MICMGHTYAGRASADGSGRMTMRQYKKFIASQYRPVSAGAHDSDAPVTAHDSQPGQHKARDEATGSRPNTAPGSAAGSRPSKTLSTKEAAPTPVVAWSTVGDGSGVEHREGVNVDGEGLSSGIGGEGQSGQPQETLRGSRRSSRAIGDSAVAAGFVGNGAGMGAATSSPEESRAQRAPAAPALRVRMRKSEGSLGSLRPPRLRVP